MVTDDELRELVNSPDVVEEYLRQQVICQAAWDTLRKLETLPREKLDIVVNL